MRTSVMIGVFSDEVHLLDAARRARASGLTVVDAFTPFAVHGMEEAAGLPDTRLGFVCFALGIVGGIVAMGGQLLLSALDWPVNIGGKSFTAIPALVPITFEVIVLFAALGSVLTFFVRQGLYPGRVTWIQDAGVTDAHFVLAIGVDGTPQVESQARDILKASLAERVEPSEVES